MKEFHIDNNKTCLEAIKAHAEMLGYKWEAAADHKYLKFRSDGIVYSVFSKPKYWASMSEFFNLTRQDCADPEPITQEPRLAFSILPFQEQIVTLYEENSDLKDRLARVAAENVELKSRIAQSHQNNVAYKERIETLEKNKKELIKQLSNYYDLPRESLFEAANAKLRKELNQIIVSKNRLSDDIGQLNIDRKRLFDERNAAVEENKVLKNVIEMLKNGAVIITGFNL